MEETTAYNLRHFLLMKEDLNVQAVRLHEEEVIHPGRLAHPHLMRETAFQECLDRVPEVKTSRAEGREEIKVIGEGTLQLLRVAQDLLLRPIIDEMRDLLPLNTLQDDREAVISNENEIVRSLQIQRWTHLQSALRQNMELVVRQIVLLVLNLKLRYKSG